MATVPLGPKGSYTVQAGVFRRRVTIQSRTDTQDAAGGVTASWTTTWGNIPAAIDEQGGKEFFQAQQIQAKNTAVISIRWRPNINEKMRVLHYRYPGKSPDIYNIEGMSIDPTGRKIITLFCAIRSAEGFRADG
jgi:SPP1 family predicted phage head-tail adaptor